MICEDPKECKHIKSFITCDDCSNRCPMQEGATCEACGCYEDCCGCDEGFDDGYRVTGLDMEGNEC